ncbi:MAG: hypothetical protein K9W44_04615 [Candidatus Lokiarchaeota archaeon]|nr:hypothetical protein [Candidatus Harpocratesius repetitus]
MKKYKRPIKKKNNIRYIDKIFPEGQENLPQSKEQRLKRMQKEREERSRILLQYQEKKMYSQKTEAERKYDDEYRKRVPFETQYQANHINIRKANKQNHKNNKKIPLIPGNFIPTSKDWQFFLRRR